MKEKDFEDIGKRLRDLETEPPENGWNNIFTSLNVAPPLSKISWFRKYWPKFLLMLLLVPAGMHLFAPNQKEVVKSASLEKTNSTLTPSDATNDVAIDRTEIENTGEKQPPLVSKANQESGNDSRQSLINDLNNEHPEETKNGVIIKSITNDTAIRRTEQFSDPNTSKEKNNRLKNSNQNIWVPTAISNETTVTGNNVNGLEQSTEPGVLLAGMNDASQAENTAPPDNLKPKNVTEDKQISPVTDSASILLDVNRSNKADSIANVAQKQTSSSKLRLTISFLPLYGNKTARPDTGDDILVTGLKRKEEPLKIDLGFAVGVGMALRENLYIDAQITYSNARQNTFLSYATGKVDTLLAVQQPDQSVRIIPVYETASREFSNKYSYIGLRFGATQYFWANSKRRFNISAIVGTHYLASATVKEKVNGTWISVNTSNLDKINYTATIGVGYNLSLQKGWELMINPSITHYLRSVKTAELPYNFRQQSYGLNLMLSKTIGKS